MKRLFFTLLLFATMAGYAYDFKYGNLYYNITSNEVPYTVEVSGAISSSTQPISPSITVAIPETVTYNGTTYSVTSIRESAFFRCYSLSSVTIPNSVTSIGDDAFYDCHSLSSVTIGNSVTSIGDDAFYDCSSLTSITIPNSVTSIGEEAFVRCTSLTSMFVEEGNTIYDSRDNCNAIIETETNTLIAGCQNTTIPNSVTSIGKYAFGGCSSLTSITLPNSVTSIGEDAFWYCSSLSSIIIPNSVTNIGDGAFAYCKRLTSITIGNSVRNIGNYAFSHCEQLTSITIPNSVMSVGDYAFCYCGKLSYVTIGNSVTSIGNSAFNSCYKLRVTEYTGDVAGWCKIKFSFVNSNPMSNTWNNSQRTLIINGKEIENLVIPNTVDSIHNYAFYGCTSIDTLTIPDGVTSIGKEGFADCPSLTTIYVDATTPPTLGEETFNGTYAKCYIPCGTRGVYYDSNWSGKFGFEERPLYTSSGSYESYFNWKYKDSKLSLSGKGDIPRWSCTPWELLIDSIQEIEIENGITNIPADAFSNYTKLNKITLPSSLEEIGANAFANCRRLYEIYSYASIPPLAEMSSFTNYNATLYVPCEHKQYYQSDMVFSLFNKVECISSEEVETDGVIVVPGANNVTITWLKEDGAEIYSIVIKKDGEVVCTLTFNSAGQLINIAFAPGRNGNHPAQYAEQVGNGKGYRFTVTGLEEGTHYTYNIDVRDTANKTIKSHTGEFTTESTTAVENIEVSENDNAQKLIRNGQLIIIRNGVEYNAVGQEL